MNHFYMAGHRALLRKPHSTLFTYVRSHFQMNSLHMKDQVVLLGERHSTIETLKLPQVKVNCLEV